MTVPPGHEDAPSPVPPGTGWPGDPASAATPVARSAAGVARQARSVRTVPDLDARVSVCSACPRLVRWREDVARTKRRAFADEPYWGRPVPGWGATRPQVLVVGLAPAAHGANRTGRIFTGDRSGDWLFAALHRAGLAVQPESVHAADGQRLVATRMVAAVRCAPPDNQPTTDERDACAPWLHRELALVSPSVHAIVALGGYGWDALLRAWTAVGGTVPRPRPRFGHGATALLTTADARTVTLVGSFHPSQQNTFTGRLTPAMLDDVLIRARAAAGVR